MFSEMQYMNFLRGGKKQYETDGKQGEQRMLQLNIAICDDVCKDAEALEGMLKEMLPDSVIRKFSAGEILLKLLEKTGNPFQLIFLHIQLHGKDGISISEEIRKLDKQVPIFLISDDDRYYKQAFEVFAYQ